MFMPLMEVFPNHSTLACREMLDFLFIMILLMKKFNVELFTSQVSWDDSKIDMI